MFHRIIPRLDIKGPSLVKGIHLEGLRVLGLPKDFANYYYENGADELIYQDVVASLYDRNSLSEFVERTAQEIFIPMTVGGGIRNQKDIFNLLRSGADKVSINTAAVKNSDFIKEASENYGSSTIVISVEVIKHNNGTYELFIDNGRQPTGIEISEWLDTIQSNGAGEIVLTSVDREGTLKGVDLDLIKIVLPRLDIPLIYHGGIGKVEDLTFLDDCYLSGTAIASAFHYDYLSNNFIKNDQELEGNTSYLESAIHSQRGFSIVQLKDYLSGARINVRHH